MEWTLALPPPLPLVLSRSWFLWRLLPLSLSRSLSHFLSPFVSHTRIFEEEERRGGGGGGGGGEKRRRREEEEEEQMWMCTPPPFLSSSTPPLPLLSPSLQPVPEKNRLEMLVEMRINFHDGGETLVNYKFKSNQNLNSNLYHEIQRNLSV